MQNTIDTPSFEGIVSISAKSAFLSAYTGNVVVAKVGWSMVAGRSCVDGELQYLIGARYYDPELGMWITHDPAGQLNNPYGYSSNPVLYIDEDGRFFFLIPIVIGVALGSYSGYKIGEAKGAKGWEMFGYIAGGALIGGAAGGIGMAVGAAAGGGVIGGIAGGASSGAFQGFSMGALSGARGEQLFTATWQGAVTGAVGGGVGVGSAKYIGNIGGAFVGGAAGGFTGGALRGERGNKLWESTWKASLMSGGAAIAGTAAASLAAKFSSTHQPTGFSKAGLKDLQTKQNAQGDQFEEYYLVDDMAKAELAEFGETTSEIPVNRIPKGQTRMIHGHGPKNLTTPSGEPGGIYGDIPNAVAGVKNYMMYSPSGTIYQYNTQGIINTIPLNPTYGWYFNYYNTQPIFTF